MYHIKYGCKMLSSVARISRDTMLNIFLMDKSTKIGVMNKHTSDQLVYWF